MLDAHRGKGQFVLETRKRGAVDSHEWRATSQEQSEADQQEDIRPVTTPAIQFDKADAEQIRRIAEEANLSMKATASKLLAFALEKLAQQKKQRDANRW